MTLADFAAVKPYVFLLYAAFGLLCLDRAARLCRPGGAVAPPGRGVVSAVLAALVAVLLVGIYAVAGSLLLVAATAIGVAVHVIYRASWRAPRGLLAAAASVALALSLVWWRIEPSPPAPLPLAAFAIILGILVVALGDPWADRPARPGVVLALFLVAGALLLIDLGGYRPGAVILAILSHHWGAFIGPAQHLRAGLVPFYDMPLQYGLGPTLAISALCRGMDCWAGTEAVGVGMTLANALLLGRMVLAGTAPRGWPWSAAVIIVLFAAALLWPGYPADGSSMLAIPSVGGVRFLPTTLVAALLFFGRPIAAAVALVPALVWSPESAGMSLAVFGLCETARIGLLRASLRSAALLAGSAAALVLSHRAVFGVWIDPAAWAEYVLHIPGPLPIDPFGDALLLAAVLGLGGWLLLRRSPDPVAARRDLAATALLFATASYWLGRSHPNNICNIAPFLVLVAVRALDRPAVGASRLVEVTALGLATSVAALAFSPWHSVPYDPHVVLDIHEVVAGFASEERDIERVRGEIAGPPGLGIADFGPTYNRHASETVVWTPLDPISLWSFVPPERRQLYIRRAASRLRRSGWVVFDAARQFFFEDLRAGYTVASERRFELPPSRPGGAATRFTAACLDPRPELAATTIGPACPHP